MHSFWLPISPLSMVALLLMSLQVAAAFDFTLHAGPDAPLNLRDNQVMLSYNNRSIIIGQGKRYPVFKASGYNSYLPLEDQPLSISWVNDPYNTFLTTDGEGAVKLGNRSDPCPCMHSLLKRTWTMREFGEPRWCQGKQYDLVHHPIEDAGKLCPHGRNYAPFTLSWKPVSSMIDG